MKLRMLLIGGLTLAWSLMVSIPAIAQERVPSGDLSNFFNPPGVKTTSGDSGPAVTTSTRKIGSSGNLKSDDATAKKSTGSSSKNTAENNAAAPVESTTRKIGDSEAKSSASDSKKDTAKSGRVKIESTESTGPIEGGITFGKPRVVNWRVGTVMYASGSGVKNLVARIPVPTQWPEQEVSVYEENLPPEFENVQWEDVDTVRMLKFRMKSVPQGEQLVGTVTFQVTTSAINPPPNTSIFRLPPRRDRVARKYTSESPEISTRNSKVKKQAKALFDNNQSDWLKVQAVYDWVRENIEERAGKPQGSDVAFKNRFGPSEDRVSLFVAMCRINKVPARMVFADGTQYAEFYLVDPNDQGHWFPCTISGIREFGEIGEPKVILQKGDSFKVPGERKKRKFVPAKADWQGSKKFKPRFSREPLSAKN